MPGEWLRRASSVALLFRAALLALSLLVVLGRGQLSEALPWLIALAALVALNRRVDPARNPVLIPAIEAGVCCAGVLLTVGVGSGLLVYLPAASFAAGIAAGVRGVVLVAAVQLGVSLGGRAYLGDGLGAWPAFLASTQQWVGLATAVGLLAVWAGGLRQVEPPSGDAAGYAEAYRLLDRLRTVTRHLPGSLDPGSSAQTLLMRCMALVPSATRGAVLLVDEPSQLVPLAVVGARRVPWRSPLTEPGPLRSAYAQRVPVLDVRPADQGGRRRGSALLVLPVHLGDHAVGLVALESPVLTAFDDDRVSELEHSVAEDAIHLDTALLFGEVRAWASLQERERLAQDMHDGVAQDLAYVGFELDALRHQLGSTAPELVEDVTRLRKQLTTMVSDLRLSITDLRSGIGQERGLGSALTSYVRGVGTARGIAVHLSLDENAFRLPGETEVQLFKVAQELLTAARSDSSVRTLEVALTVDPPSASLRVQHDGAVTHPGGLDETASRNVRHLVDRLGGRLQLSPAGAGRACAEVSLEGDDT